MWPTLRHLQIILHLEQMENLLPLGVPILKHITAVSVLFSKMLMVEKYVMVYKLINLWPHRIVFSCCSE